MDAPLQCGEGSGYGLKAYNIYFKVFRALLAKDDKSSPSTSGNF
jgi:hypothetical protein